MWPAALPCGAGRRLEALPLQGARLWWLVGLCSAASGAGDKPFAPGSFRAVFGCCGLGPVSYTHLTLPTTPYV